MGVIEQLNQKLDKELTKVGDNNMIGSILALFGQMIMQRANIAAAQRQNEETMAMNKDLMKYQSELNEQHANNQQQRNLQLYEQTQSTQAKVQEMEQAGLSVGMLNGTPSTGGATATSTPQTGISGLTSANELALTAGLMQAFAQLAKTPSEIALNNANAGKAQEETEGIKIQNQYYGQEATARINKMIAETDNIEVQTSLNKIQEYINQNTADITIQQAQANLNNALQELELLQAQTNWQNLNNEQFKNLMDVEYKIRMQQLDNLITEGELGKAKISLTWTEQKKLNADIAQGWQKLSNEKADIFMRYKNAKDANDIARANSEWNESVARFKNNLQKEMQDWQMKQGNREFILQCVMQSLGAINDIWSNANETWEMLHPQPGKKK